MITGNTSSRGVSGTAALAVFRGPLPGTISRTQHVMFFSQLAFYSRSRARDIAFQAKVYISTSQSQAGVGGICFLVLLRRQNNAPPNVASRMEEFLVLSDLWAVVFKCRFEPGSAPCGLVERLIASCQVTVRLSRERAGVGGHAWVAQE